MDKRAETSRFQDDEAFALGLDAADPLREFRGRFHLPTMPTGESQVYLSGNSLGLQPRTSQAIVREELEDWASLAVEGHFRGRRPWYSYHELVRDTGARVVGALPSEVVMMNSLTVNLHLMMVSFFRPTAGRYKVVADGPLFPSDRFALRSQLEHHGVRAEDGLIVVTGEDDNPIDEARFEDLLAEEGDAIALVILSGVNYHTGQFFDIERVTRAARDRGCIVGLDLAHAAGNVPLKLHEWDVDFAVWCSYKYLNAGPGAVAGCFVHERHGTSHVPRFAGWWGVDPATRFDMQAQEAFVAQGGAEGWQLSNPPILAMAPLKASLEVFDEVGMDALRSKSRLLTGYLDFLVRHRRSGGVRILTPRDPDARGCQLSIDVGGGGDQLVRSLAREGVVVDYRPPGVIRAAPVPLYNTFHDVWRFAQALSGNAGGTTG